MSLPSFTGKGFATEMAHSSIDVEADAIAVTWATFVIAERLDVLLGETGRSILTRLLGMLLAALSVQFVLDGLRDYGLIGGAG